MTNRPQFAGVAAPRPATESANCPIPSPSARSGTPRLTPPLQPAISQGESCMDTVKLPDEGRRSFLAASAAAGAVSLLPAQMAAAAGDTAIRPFRVNVPEADLADLRKRIAATKWPEREQVADATQGVQLATMQKLAQYWANEHDWRKCEAKINAVPNFITEIDGLDIHFIHVRSKHENALPMIVTHGWPGSIVEQMKIIEPLTNPTAHGGTAADAFHLVIPS